MQPPHLITLCENCNLVSFPRSLSNISCIKMSSLILSDIGHKFPKLIGKKNGGQFSNFISETEKINFHYNLQIFLFCAIAK